MRRGSRSGPSDETANATSTFAASVCAVVVRPAAFRTMALRRGRTTRIRPSLSPTQSPAPTSRPSCLSRPGRRERRAPASVQTSNAPRWTAATRPGTSPGSRFSASSEFQPSSGRSNPGNTKLLHARWDAATRPLRKERPALGRKDQGGDKRKHHLFRTSSRQGRTQVTAAMRVRQLTPNLIQLTRLRFVNAFLVREDDGFTLVDTTVARGGDARGRVASRDTRDRWGLAGAVFTTLGGTAVSSHFTLPFPLAAMATWDKELNLRSARTLRALEAKLLAVGHGDALRDPVSEMV